MSGNIDVDAAVESYLNDKEPRVSESTVDNHRYQLSPFEGWVEEHGDISCLQDIDPIHISQYRRYRTEGLAPDTIKNQMSVLRCFFRFCARMGWIDSGLVDSIELTSDAGQSRSNFLSSDRAKEILNDLEKYSYGSVDHVIMILFWTCGLRIGALRSIDLPDYHSDERYVEVRHRPETDTPLKNKMDSERDVNLHGWVCDVIDDWIQDRRPDTTDEHGREPLLTTGFCDKRIAKSTIRERVYRITDCGSIDTAGCECSSVSSQCSDSVCPHAIRRGSITHWISEHDKSLVSDRCDVSVSVLEKHYSELTEAEKREKRRDAFGL